MALSVKARPFLAVLAVIVVGLFLFPVAWMVMTSFKSATDIFTVPPKWIFRPTLDNYLDYISRARVLDRYLNTVLIALGSSLLSLFAGSLAGYALTRLRIRGRAVLAGLILASRVIPSIALIIPMYFLFRRLNILDTHLAMILAYSTFLIPYVVWLTRGFFMDLPASLEEAATLDGCSYLGAFFRVVFPCSLPGLLATFVYCIILAWNELLYALVLTNRRAVTIPVSLAGMAADTEQGALWGPMTAIGTLTVIPVVLFALFVQKWLVRGLVEGSVKG